MDSIYPLVELYSSKLKTTMCPKTSRLASLPFWYYQSIIKTVSLIAKGSDLWGTFVVEYHQIKF